MTKKQLFKALRKIGEAPVPMGRVKRYRNTMNFFFTSDLRATVEAVFADLGLERFDQRQPFWPGCVFQGIDRMVTLADPDKDSDTFIVCVNYWA